MVPYFENALKARTAAGERTKRYITALPIGILSGLMFMGLIKVLTTISMRILDYVKIGIF